MMLMLMSHNVSREEVFKEPRVEVFTVPRAKKSCTPLLATTAQRALISGSSRFTAVAVKHRTQIALALHLREVIEHASAPCPITKQWCLVSHALLPA